MIAGQVGRVRAALAALAVIVVAAPAFVPAPEAQARGTLQVYLARHGQTDGNLKGIHEVSKTRRTRNH